MTATATAPVLYEEQRAITGRASVWAVSVMRDEADIAPYAVRHLLEQGCEGVIVADNLSRDGTGDLCADAGAEVVLDPEPGHWQGRKMTALAHMAADQGAEWIIPFDADEMWSGPTAGISLADVCRGSFVDVLQVAAYDFLPHADDNPLELNPFRRLRYRRPERQQFYKVAFRWNPGARLAEGNHSVVGAGKALPQPWLTIRHCQWRSLQQMKRKVIQGTAALNATTLPDSEGAHWRRLASLSGIELFQAFHALADEPAVYDPLP